MTTAELTEPSRIVLFLSEKMANADGSVKDSPKSLWGLGCMQYKVNYF